MIDVNDRECLVPDAQHPGRFLPLSRPLDDLREARLRLATAEVTTLLELILPGKDFWILVRDPDDEYSDALATWGLPAEGDFFLLLCQSIHRPQLDALRDLGLLEWVGPPVEQRMGGVVWWEYHDCRILRSRWEHVAPKRESAALVEALRPRPDRLTISLEGGLSVPGQSVWLQGYPARMRVRATDRSLQWEIRRRCDTAIIHPKTAGEAHQPIDLPDLPPGEYDIVVSIGGRAGRRVLRVASWDDLGAATPARGYATQREHFTLLGAHLPGDFGDPDMGDS